MKAKKPRLLRNAGPDEIDRAKKIVFEMLGDEFEIDLSYPKNVGQQGDQGIDGDTIVIVSPDYLSTNRLMMDHEKLEQISLALANQCISFTRVLVEFYKQD